MATTDKDRAELEQYKDPFEGVNMSEDVQDVNLINKRLRELNKEFRELSALKDKLVAQNAINTIQEKYGDYKIIVKPKENKELDFNMVTENNLRIAKSIYGLNAAVYTVSDQEVYYHIAKTEEEADQIRAVERLFNVGEKVKAQVKENKQLTAQQILDLFEGARDEQQLEESEDSKEVSE